MQPLKRCDVFETDEVLTVVIALPGVELDQVKVTLSAGMLHGHFERRIELPPTRFEMSSRNSRQ